jgi:hypothetical protein
MSTYWYFECLDHTPPLRSAEEFTQHTEDRYWDRALELVANRPVERYDAYWTLDRIIPSPTDEQRTVAYFGMNARAFLSEHPTCRIGLVNGYDERRLIEGTTP